MSLRIDDSNNYQKPKIEVNEYGTVRVDGKTEREMLKEYRERFGEEKYKVLKEKIQSLKRTK